MTNGNSAIAEIVPGVDDAEIRFGQDDKSLGSLLVAFCHVTAS